MLNISTKKYLFVIILLSVFWYSTANAAISRVQTNAAGVNNATSISVSWPSATTTGNLLVAIVSVRGGSNTTITPPAGLGWTLAIRSNNGTTVSTAIYYTQNAASQSGASKWGLSPSARATLRLIEYSGAAISSVLDKTATSSGSSVTGNSGTTATTIQANEVAVAGISASNAGRTYSLQTNSFTEVGEVNSGGGANGVANVSEEKILSATGAQSVAATISSSSVWAGAIATFKAVTNTAPNAPTLVSPSNGSTINDNTPTLSANYSDPDVGDTGTTSYRIATSSANCLAGTVVASGVSSATASNNQNTTWTPASSIGSDGTYYWCAQNNDGVLTSSWTSMGNFILDTTAPVLTEVTPVTTPTTDTTPDYTFNTTEAGTITYGGDCSSATTSALSGNNTITFNTLSVGTHSNCTIRVTDAVGNISSILNVTSFTIEAPNPVPTTTSIYPNSKTVGETGFTMTVRGTGFLSGSVVKFNGSARATSFVSSTQLSATILTGDLINVGSFLVVVENPSPGGGDSNAQIFVVHNVIPNITSIVPTSKPVGSAQFSMIIYGNNFMADSQVKFGGANRVTTFISSTELSAVILLSDLATAGTFSITVFNPSTGETSNAQSFTVGILGRHEFNYSKTFYGSASLRK